MRRSCVPKTGRSGAGRKATASATRATCRWPGPRPRASPGNARCREWGDSTPAIWGDAIFLTTQVDNDKLLLLKIDKQTGRIEWTRQVGAEACPHQPLQGKTDDQRRHQMVPRDAELCQPLARDRRRAGRSPLRQRRPGGLRLRRQPALASQLAEGLRRLHDLVGTRQQPRALRRPGDLGLHAGLVRRPAGQAVAQLRRGPRQADRPAALEDDAHDSGQPTKRAIRTPRRFCGRTAAGTELVVMGGQILDAYDPATGRRLWYLARPGRQSHDHRPGGRATD